MCIRDRVIGDGIVLFKKGAVEKHIVQLDLLADAQVGLPDEVHRKIHIADHEILVAVLEIADKSVGNAGIDDKQIPLGHPGGLAAYLMPPLAEHHIGDLNKIVNVNL